jgi:hypothetical protein
MAIIEHVFPDPDDPIFAGAFTVSFPIRLEKTTPTPPKPSASSSEGENEQRSH